MKKFFILISAFILIFCMSLFASAANMSISGIEGLTSRTTADRDKLLNTESFSESLKDFSVENKAVITIYESGEIFNLLQRSAANVLVKSSEDKVYPIRYAILEEQNISFLKFNRMSNEITTDTAISENSPFLRDILKNGSNQTFSGKAVNVTDIFVIYSKANTGGVAVYYITNNGAYIRFYDSLNNTDYCEYTEAELIKYAKKYYDYITSYEFNHDEDGNLLYGGGKNFNDYVADLPSDNIFVIISACVLGVIVLIVFGFIIGKKFLNKSKC